MKIRFINVVDPLRLQDDTEHPHGLSHRDFDMLFTDDKPSSSPPTATRGSSTG